MRPDALTRRAKLQMTTVETTALTSVDGGPTMAHVVTERIHPVGRVVLEVTGIGSELPTAMVTVHDPAIATYLRRKAAMLAETAYRLPEVNAGDPCRHCAGEGWPLCPACVGTGHGGEAD